MANIFFNKNNNVLSVSGDIVEDRWHLNNGYIEVDTESLHEEFSFSQVLEIFRQLYAHMDEREEDLIKALASIEDLEKDLKRITSENESLENKIEALLEEVENANNREQGE